MALESQLSSLLIISYPGSRRWSVLDWFFRCSHFLWLHRYLQGRSYCKPSLACYRVRTKFANKRVKKTQMDKADPQFEKFGKLLKMCRWEKAGAKWDFLDASRPSPPRFFFSSTVLFLSMTLFHCCCWCSFLTGCLSSSSLLGPPSSSLSPLSSSLAGWLSSLSSPSSSLMGPPSSPSSSSLAGWLLSSSSSLSGPPDGHPPHCPWADWGWVQPLPGGTEVLFLLFLLLSLLSLMSIMIWSNKIDNQQSWQWDVWHWK